MRDLVILKPVWIVILEAFRPGKLSVQRKRLDGSVRKGCHQCKDIYEILIGLFLDNWQLCFPIWTTNHIDTFLVQKVPVLLAIGLEVLHGWNCAGSHLNCNAHILIVPVWNLGQTSIVLRSALRVSNQNSFAKIRSSLTDGLHHSDGLILAKVRPIELPVLFRVDIESVVTL